MLVLLFWQNLGFQISDWMCRQRVCRQWLFAMLGIYSYDSASPLVWETSVLRESMRSRVDFFQDRTQNLERTASSRLRLASSSPCISSASGCREHLYPRGALIGLPGRDVDVASNQRLSGCQAPEWRAEDAEQKFRRVDTARPLATGGCDLATSASSERDSR